jgi:hypothetical protein
MYHTLTKCQISCGIRKITLHEASQQRPGEHKEAIRAVIPKGMGMRIVGFQDSREGSTLTMTSVTEMNFHCQSSKVRHILVD